jgi:hypothetical protein
MLSSTRPVWILLLGGLRALLVDQDVKVPEDFLTLCFSPGGSTLVVDVDRGAVSEGDTRKHPSDTWKT